MGFFSTAREKSYAKQLAEQLSKDLPASLAATRKKLMSVNKVTRLLERTYQQATDYQTSHRLGFIRRAVLANSFKWELKALGYPDDFINVATEGLVVAISKVKVKI